LGGQASRPTADAFHLCLVFLLNRGGLSQHLLGKRLGSRFGGGFLGERRANEGCQLQYAFVGGRTRPNRARGSRALVGQLCGEAHRQRPRTGDAAKLQQRAFEAAEFDHRLQTRHDRLDLG
jgi:hypothetical protein